MRNFRAGLDRNLVMASASLVIVPLFRHSSPSINLHRLVAALAATNRSREISGMALYLPW